MAKWLQWIIIIVIVLFLLSWGVVHFMFGGSSSKDNTGLSEVYSYLAQARHIRISNVKYDTYNKSVSSKLIMDSGNQKDIDIFLDVLKNRLNDENSITVFKSMKVFTPNYRVELTCKAMAVIEFIFYEDTNAACLRNKDCFFFAEFSREDADKLKEYFEGLR